MDGNGIGNGLGYFNGASNAPRVPKSVCIMVARVVLARCPSNLISQPRSNGSVDSADGDSGRSKMQILPASRWPKLSSRTLQRCDARMRRAVAEVRREGASRHCWAP
jgi:hypothetical protein